MKKVLLMAAMLGAAALTVPAKDYVTVSMNFYNPDGVITVEGKLPEGVELRPKIRFNNPKLKGHAFTLWVDLDKAQSFDIKLKVRGEGVIDPSVNLTPVPVRKGWEVECQEFEFCGDASDKTPFTFKKWTSMGPKPPFTAEDGEIITVKAKFKLIK